MKFQKSLPFFYYSFISFVIMATGCVKPILKMPESLPPIIKSYKYVRIYGNNSRMKNTGVYLAEGDFYSLVGTGKIDTWPSNPGRGLITPDRRTIARIGKNPIFRLFDNQFSMGYVFFHTTYTSGNLYLGIQDGELTKYGKALQPEYYRDNTGFLNFDIIVWKRKDWVQIVNFFEGMKRMDPTNKQVTNALNTASRYKDYYIAALKTSKEIEETKKELKELKKDDEPKEKELEKSIAKEDSATSTTAIKKALGKDKKIAQLEAKLAKLTATLNELAKLKEKWQKEQGEADLLREKLSKVTKEKAVLAVKLESEADVRKQLESSLKERETALKRKETLVESLYEKERQLKSKNLQLELAQGRSEEYKGQLEILNQKANQMNEELKLAKSKEATAIAEDELNKILNEKSNLQREAINLKEKEAKLSSEVSNLSAVAAKTRIEAERAKKELTAMRERETQLIDQVAQLKTRLSKGMAPVLIITKPNHGLKIQSSSTMLNLTAVDDRGINNISVSLNGESLKLSDARGLVLGTVDKISIGKRFDIKERLLLQYGQNRIEVSVTDTDGMSQKEIVNVIREKERGDIWAVVIGINQYKNKRNLKYAVNDARAFKNYLTEYIGVLEENMFFLTDQNATRENIQSLLGTQLRRKASKNDTVIIFYAGHGAVETDPANPDGDGYEKYLLPYDAKLDDLYSTAIAMREIKNIFQRIRSDRLIFIADTCYSGASGGRTMVASKGRASLSEKFFERISKGKGRVIISSSSANEISKEDDKLKHGIFSYYLLEGLKGKADHDSDGIITIAELFGYLSQKVPEASGQDQHPVRKGEIEGELVIGRTK